jgi:hypothetical protein
MANQSNSYDPFGDVDADTQGVFSAEQAALRPGLKQLRTVHAVVRPEGILMQFDCQVCGIPTVMMIEYPEVVALKYGVNPVIAFRAHPSILQEPTRWEFSPGATVNDPTGWRPDIKCCQCNANANKDFCIEQHEPELLLQGARRRGYINPAGEQQISQICAQAAQGGQGVRR